MENIKDYLEDYSDTKSKILAAVIDVVENNEIQTFAAQKHNIEGNEKLLAMFKRNINVIRDRLSYNDKKIKTEKAVKYLYNNKGSKYMVARRFGITTLHLDTEFEIYMKSRRFYIYDKITKNGENKDGVFTFVEEDLLMQILCKFKEIILRTKRGCCCWICTMNRLSFIAYDFAKDKGKKCPESWDDKLERVDENWLTEFEMRHTGDFLENFPNNCLKSPPKPACHAEEGLEPSISNVYMQTGSDSWNISDIAIKSDEIKKLEGHLNTYKRIKSAVEKVIDPKKVQKVVTRTHGIIQEEEIYLMTIDIIKKKNQYIKDEEGLKKTFHRFRRNPTSELRKNVAMERVYIRRFASDFNTDEVLAELEYWENKESIMADNYKYVKVIKDRSTELLSKKVGFTYNEQFDLLEQLCFKKAELIICKCQLCASELLSTLAEKYIQSTRGSSNTNIWINSTEKSYWLYSFIIRHRETFFETFPKDDCEENKVFKRLELKCQSSLPSTEKESQSISTSRSPPKRKSDSAQTSEDQPSQKHTDRLETLNKLTWHERLHVAAEKIIEKGDENYEDIAKEYNIVSNEDRESLHTKIDILNKKNKYIETKGKIEETFEKIFSEKMNEMNKNEALKNINLPLEIKNREYEKFKTLKNKNEKYVYDELIDNAIFTYTQEFSFFEDLISHKKKYPSQCWCYSCSMIHLKGLVHTREINIKGGEDPSFRCNETKGEKWWSEFEMRHSRKISEMFLPSCTYTNVSKPLSLPSEEETLGPSPKKRRTE